MYFPALSKYIPILWLLSYTVTTCNGYGVTWRRGLSMTHAHGICLIGDTRVVSVMTIWFSDYAACCGVMLGFIGCLSDVVAWIFLFSHLIMTQAPHFSILI